MLFVKSGKPQGFGGSAPDGNVRREAGIQEPDELKSAPPDQPSPEGTEDRELSSYDLDQEVKCVGVTLGFRPEKDSATHSFGVDLPDDDGPQPPYCFSTANPQFSG
jgi:hypothetical protein